MSHTKDSRSMRSKSIRRNADGPALRRGVSTLFVVGCILWACVFAGLFVLRYLQTQNNSPEQAVPPGTIDERAEGNGGDAPAGEDDPEDDGKPETIVLELGAERREAFEMALDQAKTSAEALAIKVEKAEAAVEEQEAALAKAAGTDDEPAAEMALATSKTSLKEARTERAEAETLVADLEIRVEAAHNGWSPDGLPDFELTERSGDKVTRDDLLGQATVYGFVFTRCPGPCPRVSLRMNELQKATEELDLRLVTITVDPERDTPDVLRTYADNYGADSDRWLFLTGDIDVIYPLIGKGFAMPVQKTATTEEGGEYDVIHTSNLLYVDANGIVRGKYNSLDDQAFGDLKKRLRKEVPKREQTPEPAKPPESSAETP